MSKPTNKQQRARNLGAAHFAAHQFPEKKDRVTFLQRFDSQSRSKAGRIVSHAQIIAKSMGRTLP